MIWQQQDTRAVHAGREDLRELGVHVPPLDLSTTYPIASLDLAAESLGAMAEGAAPRHGERVYARLHNDGVARFERALAELEGAESAVAFASGMAALSAVLLAVRARDREVVAIRPLYGGSDHLLASRLLGVPVRFAALESIATAVDERTGLVIVETPANPTLDLVDLRALRAQIGRVPLLVDNTFATPILQKPIEFGAELVLHSGTKYLGGHGDVLAGVVAGSAAWCRELRRIRIATGAVLHPLAAYLLHRGLQTLPLRVRAAQSTACELARRLAGDARVFDVRLPQGELVGAGAQMRGCGSILSFRVHGGFAAAQELMRSLRCITPAVSLGCVDSLLQHPAALTHQTVSPEAREATGVSDDLLRMAVGLENVDDLWQDLEQALARSAEFVGSGCGPV